MQLCSLDPIHCILPIVTDTPPSKKVRELLGITLPDMYIHNRLTPDQKSEMVSRFGHPYFIICKPSAKTYDNLVRKVSVPVTLSSGQVEIVEFICEIFSLDKSMQQMWRDQGFLEVHTRVDDLINFY